MTYDFIMRMRTAREPQVSKEVRGLLAALRRTEDTITRGEADKYGGATHLLAKNDRRMARLDDIRRRHGSEMIDAARQLQVDLNAYYRIAGTPGNVREVW